ncbi:hypothetical protein NQ318_017040 [Aromia moschata]|uniref:RNase H type-1 domain-containing protein n=1 Tax=Aromia moschata TaxID=1265417 RepID=A0AAV8XD57_9CUCU|nr:hypothetical protein NQ318_017040 [Aromia moschata]
MRSERIGRDIIFHKPYRVIVPKEGEEDSHIPVQQNGTIWYTDGSKTEQSTGAGATNRDPDCEICINLGNFATVFLAEITAISACAQDMTRRSYTHKRIQIISDSQAALKALGAVEIHSQVVKDCMDSLTKLAEHKSITLKWMRGHQGHEGNEIADFLAKKRAEVSLIGPEPTCGLAYRTARRVMKDLLREKHISHWAKVPGISIPHARIAYISAWKTLAYDPRAKDNFVLVVLPYTPAPALSPILEPSVNQLIPFWHISSLLEICITSFGLGQMVGSTLSRSIRSTGQFLVALFHIVAWTYKEGLVVQVVSWRFTRVFKVIKVKRGKLVDGPYNQDFLDPRYNIWFFFIFVISNPENPRIAVILSSMYRKLEVK